MEANFGESASGLTESLMKSMPYIRMANPIRMLPISFFRLLLADIIRMIPTSANTGEKDSGFRSLTQTLSLSIPIRLRIHAVTVVPILDPIITPTVPESCMMPELTSPTSITVTAEELWITAVIPIPRNRLFSGLDVIRLKISSSFPPANFSRPCDIRFIP